MDSCEKSSPGVATTESWLFVTNNNIEEEAAAGKIPESHLKSTEEMEDSDGISVISESEMFKNQMSDGEIEKSPSIPEEVDDDENFEAHESAKNNEEEDVKEPNLLTPPHTPNEISREEEELQVDVIKRYDQNALDEVRESFEAPPIFHKSNHAVLLLVTVSLIIAILYTNVSSLKNELARTVSAYEQRILRLEEENQLLRAQLDELMQKLKSPYDIDIAKRKVPQKYEQKIVQKQQQQPSAKPPPTKNVWLGGEKEEVVKVLDTKHNTLPDYCYFTDENDLFYEYNMENCEKKKQKLDERMKKSNNNKRDTKQQQKENGFVADQDTGSDKFNADDIWKSSDKMYNDFMSKTADEILQSLNEEIQQIKNSRHPQATTSNDDKLKNDKKTFAKEKHKTNGQYGSSTYEGSAERKMKDNRKRDGKFDDSHPSKRPKQERPMKRKENKEGNSGDWADQRSKAREDARMKKENDENWYLKRKNERELHRMDNLRT